MPAYEVRAPFNSEGHHVTGKYRYCTDADFIEQDCTPDGDIHQGASSCCGYSWQNYRDLSKSAGSAVYFYGSSNVASIRTNKFDNVVCPGNGAISHAVRVSMFPQADAGGTRIGSVLFVHIANRVDDGVYNQRSIQVGTITDGYVSGCFTGPHIHMQETDEAQAQTGSGLCCNVPVYADSDVVYKWVY